MMDKKSEVLDLIPKQRVLPLYYYKDTQVSVDVLKALYNAGIRAVEYTNRGQSALENFKTLRAVCNSELKGMYLGVGTVKNAEAARMYVAEGADFIVTPGLVTEVVEVADKHNLLCAPGCMTPSEIISAENMGVKLVKIFPGNILGPAFVKAIKPVFPDMMFMPTGGVDLEEANIRAWFDAGVCAVGMGSKLIRKDLLSQKDYQQIEALTIKALELAGKNA